MLLQPWQSISIAEDRTQHHTSPPDCLLGNTAAFAHQATTYTDAWSSQLPLQLGKRGLLRHLLSYDEVPQSLLPDAMLTLSIWRDIHQLFTYVSQA